MTTKQRDRVDFIRGFVSPDQRISLTELTRSKGWRDDLVNCDIMEVVDRNDTAAYLVSPEGMRALLRTIDLLEEEVERTQIYLLFSSRQQMNDWSSGERLANKAKQYLDSKEAVLKGVLDADQ